MQTKHLKVITAVLILILGLVMVFMVSVLSRSDSHDEVFDGTVVTDPYGRYAFNIPAGYEVVDMDSDERVLGVLPRGVENKAPGQREAFYVFRKGVFYIFARLWYDTYSGSETVAFSCGDSHYFYQPQESVWELRFEGRNGHDQDKALITCTNPRITSRQNSTIITPSDSFKNNYFDKYSVTAFNNQDLSKATKRISFSFYELTFGAWYHNPENRGDDFSEYWNPPEPGTTTLAPLLNDYQDLFMSIENSIRWMP